MAVAPPGRKRSSYVACQIGKVVGQAVELEKETAQTGVIAESSAR